MSRYLPAVSCLALAGALAALFWWPLFHGGGFIGGDVYTFFLPQKAYYAESLRSGEFPLWNNRVGHGYPILGESQTGAFYPFHLWLYTTLDLHDAYNANHLLHYGLAFLFAVAFARSIGLGYGGAAMAATVYVYGWFPVRGTLEWAIITGAWLPAALCCAEQLLRTRMWRYGIGLSGVVCLQMLAGHFHISFMTQLLLAGYIPVRLWWANDEREIGNPKPIRRRRLAAVSFAAMACGFALAAAQLLPTFAFKQTSHRATTGDDHRLAQGSLPAEYWSQTIAPWRWYSPAVNRDEELKRMAGERNLPITNQIEAHLYSGLIPLMLALAGLFAAVRERRRVFLFFASAGLLALLYTPGWMLPVTRHLPGFSYFQGPGRFGLLTTFAVALLAGYGMDRLLAGGRQAAAVAGGVFLLGTAGVWWLTAASIDLFARAKQTEPFALGTMTVSDHSILLLGLLGLAVVVTAALLERRRVLRASLIVGALLAGTVADLWIVNRLTMRSANTPMIADPPVAHLAESPLRRILAESKTPPRLFAPGGNLPTLFGAASYPPYLTFGPQVYSSDEYRPPADDVAATIRRLNRLGVTHILTFEELDDAIWPVTLRWRGIDPVFNRALAASRKPALLYEFHPPNRRGRAFGPGVATPAVTELTANRVTIDVASTSGGVVTLTELTADGWRVNVDGQPAEPQTVENLFRAVEVPANAQQVVWTYRPTALYWGAAISIVTLCLLAAVAHVRFWHPRRWRFLEGDDDGV